MNKTIIIINGVGGCGKDTLIDLLKEQYKVKNISSITPIKEIAKHAGWNGEKTNKARKFLSDLKKLLTDFNELPQTYLLNEQEKFLLSDEDIMFVHIREPHEISKFVSLTKCKTKTLLILPREELKNKDYGNESDNNVYNYNYDLYFNSDKPLNEIAPIWLEFIREAHE